MHRFAVALLLVVMADPGVHLRDARPLTAGALAVAASVAVASQPREARQHDEAAVRRALDDAVARVQRRMRAAPTSPVDALNGVVFDELGFVREVDDPSLDFVLLPSVVRSRRGSCVGLGTLYLALSEALRWKAEGILLPGHFYVRVDEQGRPRNVELLRRGEQMSDEWYRHRFPIPGGSAASYGTPLSTTEVLGVIAYDIGNDRRRAGRLPEAQRFYDAARLHFPLFAEAHASSALVAHLLGSLSEARDGYLAAERANPNLPGVAQNLELLERERRARSVANTPPDHVRRRPVP